MDSSPPSSVIQITVAAARKVRDLSTGAFDNPSKARPLGLVALSFLSFVGLGFPGAMLGVAWPSMQATFGLPLDAIGTLLAANMAGYLLSSFANGQLLQRIGVGTSLFASTVLSVLGLLGVGFAPGWWVTIPFAFVLGLGSGVIDAGMNTYFAANHSPSLMNWLHACFGVGAALGPALMTALLAGAHSWRLGYAIVAAGQGLLALGFAATSRHWALAGPESTAAAHDTGHVRAIDTLRKPAVWAGVALFFVFVGAEASAGQWSYPLFTQARSVVPTVAGLWVSVYWASLTAGRVLFGIAVSRLSVTTLLRASVLGSALGASFLWWNPVALIGFLGLALMGFSIGPLFPMSISATPHQIGTRHAPNAIGFQVAAGGLGIAALPGLGGVLAERLGLDMIAPFLLALSLLTLLLYEGSLLLRRFRGATP
jgi:fucose permease